MKKKIKQLLRLIHIILILVFFLSSIFYVYSIFYSQKRVTSVSQGVIENKHSDQEIILALLKYVSEIDNTNVKLVTEDDIVLMDSMTVFWVKYYRVVPKNLIPNSIVLDYNLTYSGPCGSKSRLLCAMVESVGYDCRLISTPQHTMTEVDVNGTLTILDPSFNVYFLNDDGSFASSEKITTDLDFFQSSIRKLNVTSLNLTYPVDDTGYQFIAQVSSERQTIKSHLVDTLFYMKPNVFFSAVSLFLLIASLFLYFLLFIRKKSTEPREETIQQSANDKKD